MGFVRVLGAVAAYMLPARAAAHEVYVLPPDVVARALQQPAFSEWQVVMANWNLFLFWALVSAVVIFAVFFSSISEKFEKRFDPFLKKLPPYAPVISRITIGLAFLSAAYHGALFGPELPLAETFFSNAFFATLALTAIGLMLVIGFYARIAALAAFALFAVAVAVHGSYMFTYTNYLGEILLLLILGGHHLGIHTKRHDVREAPRFFLSLKQALTPYAFLILRVAFGVSLLFASLYAKVLHNNLALELAYAYPTMVHFFGFEEHFLVLGAAIVEILIAVFFIVGFEIRFTSLFLLFWLSLSLVYFGEAVWPHLILIGIPIAFIFYGYDSTSIEGRFFKKRRREPVL